MMTKSTPMLPKNHPAAQSDEATPPRIGVILKTPGITIGHGGGGPAFGAMFEKTIARALQDKGILARADACAWDNQAIGLFRVTHLHVGLVAVRNELESLRLLHRSQIAWLDYAEDVFRIWHPAGERDTVAITHQSLAAWIKMAAENLARLKE